MFLLNLKKEWNMHRSLLITFSLIGIISMAIFSGVYLVLKYADLASNQSSIILNVWMVATSLFAMISSVLPIVLMYKVIASDVGKAKVHYTLFTPQSIFVWFAPKILFVFLIQGLFALIDFGYGYFLVDAVGTPEQFTLKTQLLNVGLNTFSIGFLSLLALCIALYYSFRKKGLAWILIVTTGITYMVGMMSFFIYQAVQEQSNEVVVDTTMSLIQYGINTGIGIIFLAIALFLFSKRVEY